VVSAAAVTLVAILISIYIVSQFLRNSVGVIAPNLAAELALSPVEVGLLSSMFFFVFAAVQIPVGVVLDRFGPRVCLVAGAAITVVGTVVFAAAVSPVILIFGRALLGLGTAGSLVASLAVYAQRFPPERFATLTGVQVGIGTLDTLLATAPLAVATAAIGWRASFLAVGAFTFAVGLLIAVVVRDNARPGDRGETMRESLSGILAVMRTPSVGRLFVMNMAVYSTFSLIVGLWGGPYLTHIYGYGLEERGSFLLVAVLTQIAGSMLWGPMDRLIGSHKLPVDQRRGARLARPTSNARSVDAGPLVCSVWVGNRIWPAPDRARQSAVPASPGRARPYGPQHGLDGRRLPRAGRQRVRDRVVSHSARRSLRAYRLSPGLRPAGRLYPIGMFGLFRCARSPPRRPGQPRRRAFCIGPRRLRMEKGQ
jgi:MFS family permease